MCHNVIAISNRCTKYFQTACTKNVYNIIELVNQQFKAKSFPNQWDTWKIVFCYLPSQYIMTSRRCYSSIVFLLLSVISCLSFVHGFSVLSPIQVPRQANVRSGRLSSVALPPTRTIPFNTVSVSSFTTDDTNSESVSTERQQQLRWSWRWLMRPVTRLALSLVFTLTMGKSPALASTMPSTFPLLPNRFSGIISQPVEIIVNNYIRRHMFEDEAFEPNLDVYREINHDLNTGQHRKNLIAATSSTLGKDVVKSKSNVSIFDFEQHGRRLVIYLARKGVPMNVIIGICALTPFVAFIIFRFLWERYLVLDRKLDLLYYKRKYGPDFR